MNRFAFLILVVGFAAPAWALPPIPPYVAEIYKDGEYAKIAAAIGGLSDKCSLCHIPKADKKGKGHGLNDYGQAVHKALDHKKFMALHKTAKENPADAQAAQAIMQEALLKAEGAKNAAGTTFGELIKAGTLPGKND